MTAGTSFVPLQLTVSCGSAVVHVRYSVHLETDAYTGDIGAGETDIADDDIAVKVVELTRLIKAKMEEAVGVAEAAGKENPLGDEPPMETAEEPL